MGDAEEERTLTEHFRELVSRDPVKTSVVDITKLGIMEVTREKRNRNIREQIGMV
jgi:ribonuclease G